MQKLKSFIPLIILTIIILISWQYVDSQTIINYKNELIKLTEYNLILSSLIFTTAYFIAVALSLPIATILTLLAGVVFGPVLGTSIVVIGATMGACCIFLIVKNASQNIDLLNKYKKSKHLLTLQNNLKQNAASYLLFARLVPVFPFVLVNIAPATVDVKFKTFLWTTLVGITPGSFIYCYLGYQSGKIENINDLISIEMLLALSLLGLFALTPTLLRKKKHD